MAPLLLLLADAATADAMMARSRAVAPPPCALLRQAGEVTVCGLRRADRFRVPYLTADPADPAHEPVMAERTRLLHRTTPLQDLSPFQVGGGMAGVTVTSGNGGERVTGWRPLAP